MGLNFDRERAMRKKQSWILLLLFLAFSLPMRGGIRAQPSSAPPQAADTQGPAMQAGAAQPSPQVTAYKLPPDLYRKARDRSRIHFRLALIGAVYGLVVLWLILRFGLGPKYRDWAEHAFANSFLQALLFSPLLILTISLLTLPLDVYSQVVEKKFGISVQGWPSWGWDWVKGELISVIILTVLIWLLYVVIRRSPRRWWFYFWLASLPILLVVFFIGPWVIDPMFNKFEPLQQKNPELTQALERMVAQVGETIPPERMFWMNASAKSNALNAYVTGFGASKRIVVLDTTIAKMTTPQIVFVAGHEMGHYVLHHVVEELAFFAVLLLIFFYLMYRSIGSLISRWGQNWGIRNLGDWASLPAMLVLLTVFAFVANPIANAYSRYLEHQADQYGLEITHGLTPDSGQIGAQAFQKLGEVNLADPAPNRLNVFLFYSHPSIPDRVQFSLTYNPWSNGQSGEFVK
jgi:STE24 endopeptidase